MKKLLFSVAILAVAASCSKNEVTEIAPAAQNAIGFTTLNNLTRAANDDNQSYHVFATSTTSETLSTAFYIDDYTTAESDNMQKTYYWPTDANTTLNFYAYAPHGSTSVSGTPSTSAIALTYTVGTTASEDFTVATPHEPATSGSTVALKFAHMLTKATVTIELSEALSDAKYTLTGAGNITLSVFDNVGTIDIMAASALTVTAETSRETAKLDVAYTTAYTAASTGASFIFMPQGAANCTIDITGVEIKDPSGNIILATTDQLVTYTIVDELTSFAPSTHYAITLTVDAASQDGDGNIFGDAIAVSASISEADWTEATLGLDSDNQ